VSFYYGGIDAKAFQDCFKVPLQVIFAKEIEFLLAKQLMRWEGNETDTNLRLQLTTLGKQHFGGVVALFYSPSVQQHVITLPGGEAFPRDPIEIIDEKIRTGQIYDNSTPKTTPILKSNIPNSNNNLGSDLWMFNKESKTWVKVANREPDVREYARAYSTTTTTTTTTDTATATDKGAVKGADSQYEFGNILFGGACNQKCPFCIGHQLDPQLTPDNLRKWPIDNLDRFIAKIKETNTKRLIFTGTRTDPQLYKYEAKLLALLREQIPGIHISLHTNGILSTRKMDLFNQYNTVTISFNSFDPTIYQKLHGSSQMPNLPEILEKATIPVKLSCVLTEDNITTLDQYLQTAANLGVKRLALRHLFNDEQRRRPLLFTNLKPEKFHCGNPVFNINGMEATYWIFEKTTGKSLNLFSNGHISEEYVLAKAPGNVQSSSASFNQQQRII